MTFLNMYNVHVWIAYYVGTGFMLICDASWYWTAGQWSGRSHGKLFGLVGVRFELIVLLWNGAKESMTIIYQVFAVSAGEGLWGGRKDGCPNVDPETC